MKLVNILADKIKVIFILTAAIIEEAKEIIPICKNELLNSGILENNIYTYDLDRIMSSDEICNFNAIYV